MSWDVDATILRSAILTLGHFTAESCTPVWCRSAHTCLIDKPISNALRIVTGCLHPTPTGKLFILSGIQPTERCRQKTVLSLACQGQGLEHLLYERLLFFGHLRQFKSRHPFLLGTLELLNNSAQSGTSVALCAKYRWGMEWQENTSRLHTFIKDLSPTPPGVTFPDLHVSSLTASEPALVYSAWKHTNKAWFYGVL